MGLIIICLSSIVYFGMKFVCCVFCFWIWMVLSWFILRRVFCVLCLNLWNVIWRLNLIFGVIGFWKCCVFFVCGWMVFWIMLCISKWFVMLVICLWLCCLVGVKIWMCCFLIVVSFVLSILIMVVLVFLVFICVCWFMRMWLCIVGWYCWLIIMWMIGKMCWRRCIGIWYCEMFCVRLCMKICGCVLGLIVLCRYLCNCCFRMCNFWLMELRCVWICWLFVMVSWMWMWMVCWFLMIRMNCLYWDVVSWSDCVICWFSLIMYCCVLLVVFGVGCGKWLRWFFSVNWLNLMYG